MKLFSISLFLLLKQDTVLNNCKELSRKWKKISCLTLTPLFSHKVLTPFYTISAFEQARTKYVLRSLKTMLENINCIHILFWFGISLPGYCMGRCTVRQERTLRENPTVSSGDPSCSDFWMAAVETKSSSLWKWCLRTLSILSQVHVIKVYMYDMCTNYMHIYMYVMEFLSCMTKLYCIFFSWKYIHKIVIYRIWWIF